MVIGILAILMSIGKHPSEASSQGALYTIAKQPFGPVLLIVLAIGLSAYAFWQLVKTIFDPECTTTITGKDDSADWAYLIIAGIYTAMCISACAFCSVQEQNRLIKSTRY